MRSAEERNCSEKHLGYENFELENSDLVPLAVGAIGVVGNYKGDDDTDDGECEPGEKGVWIEVSIFQMW
ncbi:hypothetical protein Vadar_024890 [Vaccinium darrowii]|uniref:Uncharacterized protein n=1 Tax=Vaccinium darrowii TaxID=229202 RepID=A0ACB7Z6D6_9ERIC|nr:hypothetical protein Vadar_024890 [Vaccinium darrowii]